MKTTKTNKTESRLNTLEKISKINAEKGKIDYSNADIGFRVTADKADIYAFGTKFEDAKYYAFKLDYSGEATEIVFQDFTFAAEKINNFDFTAVLSIDGVDMKISSVTPYDLDMKVVILLYVTDIIVQIILYNAKRFAPGLSGCYISIGIKDVNYNNVYEGCAAMISVINHDTVNNALDILIEDSNPALPDVKGKN